MLKIMPRRSKSQITFADLVHGVAEYEKSRTNLHVMSCLPAVPCKKLLFPTSLKFDTC